MNDDDSYNLILLIPLVTNYNFIKIILNLMNTEKEIKEEEKKE